MRSLHVAISAHFWGQPATGSGQYLHRLVGALLDQASPPRVTLIADAQAARRAAPPEGAGRVVAGTPFDDIYPDLAKLWFEQVSAPRVARRIGADLLHVPYFAPPLRKSLPVVVTIHDLIPMLLPAYRGNRLVRSYTALAARGARRAERILADSEASRRDILRLLAVDAARLETVYLAADPAFRPQPAEVTAAIRRKLKLPEHFALYLGGFDARKNVPHLLEAVARSEEAWPLVIAGRLPERESPLFPDPRRLVATLKLESRVRFTGWIEEEDKAPLLAAASLFVFPSSYEGFGLPVLEAMACGTATVTTTSSSLPELAGDAAALVPPGDITALQEAMDRLMRDTDARATLAARGPAQASRFSWERCARETLEAYWKVIRWL